MLASEHHIKTLNSQIDSENHVNSMLVVKIYCNLFKTLQNIASDTKLVEFFLKKRSNLIKTLNELCTSENKSYQIAFSTMLLNYVVLLKRVGAESAKDSKSINEILIEFVQYLNDLSSTVLNWDSEALFRVLVTFGTLISKTDANLEYDFILTVAKSLEHFRSVCNDICAKAQKYSPKVNACATYLLKELN